jgi:hypothetical protein
LIRRFFVLPPPERPPEDEESGESTAARWSNGGVQKSPPFYCRWGKEERSRLSLLHYPYLDA